MKDIPESVKAVKTKIADIIAKDPNFDWNNVRRNGKFVTPYNEKFIEDKRKYSDAVKEARDTYGEYSIEHYKALLEKDKWYNDNVEQKIQKDYYTRKNAYVTNVLKYAPEHFVRYKYIMHELYGTGNFNRADLSDEQLKRRHELVKELRLLRSDVYEDGTMKNMEDLHKSSVLNTYITSMRNLNEEYFEKEVVEGFEENLEYYLDIIKRYEANPTYVLNVLVASEHTRREIYTSIVEELAKIYDVDKVLYILTTNIRIIDVLTEGNNYVNDAFVYFDDFKELDPTVIELVFKNFISVKNNIGIYYLNNRLQSENASIEEQIKKVIGKPQMFEKQPEGITSMVINDLTENGLKIDLGYGLFDFVIRQKKPIAVIILGKYSDAINFIVDDYLYYYNEYIKRGFSVKVLYTLDLYHQYDKCLKELLNIAKVGTNNGRN